MPSVTATNSSSSTATSDGSIGFLVRQPKQVLDSSDFMKLLSTQMANQDPMKPMEDTAFISQMSSFSSLSQMQQLTKSFASLQSDTTKTSANGLLGRQVTALDVDGNSVTGLVSAVDSSDTEPVLTVNGVACKYSTVTKVELPTQNTTPVTAPAA